MSLSASIDLRFSARLTGANALGAPDFSPEINRLIQLADGVVANAANLLYAAERTVAESSNDDLDLAGVLTNAFGATITNAELVGLIISSKATNLSSLTIGAGSNPYLGFLGGTTPTIKSIGPGGLFVLVSPNASGLGAVAAGTGDILRIANGAGGAAVYDIAIIGRNA